MGCWWESVWRSVGWRLCRIGAIGGGIVGGGGNCFRLRLLMWRDWWHFSLLVPFSSCRETLGGFFFPMKRRGGVMPSIYFLRKEGVVSSPHACCQYDTCRRQESVLKLFPTKRRGGVVPSCMVFIQLMQETNPVLLLFFNLQNVVEESFSCFSVCYVCNSSVCNEDRSGYMGNVLPFNRLELSCLNPCTRESPSNRQRYSKRRLLPHLFQLLTNMISSTYSPSLTT